MREKILFDSSQHIIPIYVLCENKGSVKKLFMALDTGASLVRIPRDVADTLKIDLSEVEKVETLNVQDKEESSLVSLSKVRVGRLHAEDVQAIVQDLPEESRVDGLLGLSFLRNFDVEICFSEGYVEFAS